MTAPRITPSSAINTPLEEVKNLAPALTAKRVGVIGTVLVDLILAQVCLALGNISILGIKPFTFLTNWGYDLQQKAADAYKNSFAVVDARAGAAAGTTTSGSIVDIYNSAKAINDTANTASTAATSAANANVATNTAVYNGFYGSGGTGTSTQVQATVAAIKTKLTSGFNLQTITDVGSGTWTRPWAPGSVDEPKEFWAICFGSGGGGGAGQYITTSGSTTGGNGGAGGAYAAVQIAPTDIGSTVSYTVAAGASGATTNGGAATSGAQTSFGSFITTIAGRAFVSTQFGYYTTDDSQPGSGGKGGAISGSVQPVAGVGTPLASGGAAGTNATNGANAVAGSIGATASLILTTRAGGGGGGGGGAGFTGGSLPQYFRAATAGGNGGFPGGGGGGGGAMNNGLSSGSPYNTAGYGGAGANGCIVLIWK